MPIENIVVPVAIALLGLIGSYFTVRYTTRATVKVKEIDVDAAAYERADKINAGAFQRLENEVTRQGAELSRLRTTVEKLTKAFQVAVTVIEQFLTGRRPRIPESLNEYLDPRLLESYVRHVQSEDNSPVREK